MGEVTWKDEPNNRILESDERIKESCEALRDHVDNINQKPGVVLAGSVYRSREAEKINMVRIDGVEIGYRLQDHGRYMRRQMFVKVPGYKIEDLSKQDRERIMTAIFDVFLIEGADVPGVAQVAPDCMLIEQDFVPLYLVEQSPGLVTIAGGINGN